jgi:signal peptidase II
MTGVKRHGFAIAAAALAADQIFKNLLLYGYDFIVMRAFERVEVLPFFDLVMVWNRGISYGWLQAESRFWTMSLTVFQLSAAALLTWWLLNADRRMLGAGLGLLIGGALGNVIDRIRFGAVADFFLFHVGELSFWVFNIADAAITIGVVLLLADAFLRPGEKGDKGSEVERSGV